MLSTEGTTWAGPVLAAWESGWQVVCPQDHASQGGSGTSTVAARKAQHLLQDGSPSCHNLHPGSHHHVALGVDFTRQNVIMAITNNSQVSLA